MGVISSCFELFLSSQDVGQDNASIPMVGNILPTTRIGVSGPRLFGSILRETVSNRLSE